MVNLQSRLHTTADMDRPAMTRWIKRIKNTTKLPIKVQVNNRKDQIKIQVTLNWRLQCIIRVMLHWTKLMWVLSTSSLTKDLVITNNSYSIFAVVRQAAFPFGYTTALQFGWFSSKLSNTTVSTTSLPSTHGAPPQHQHASAHPPSWKQSFDWFETSEFIIAPHNFSMNLIITSFYTSQFLKRIRTMLVSANKSTVRQKARRILINRLHTGTHRIKLSEKNWRSRMDMIARRVFPFENFFVQSFSFSLFLLNTFRFKNILNSPWNWNEKTLLSTPKIIDIIYFVLILWLILDT